MGIKLAAASGGSVELVPTNTASNFTATMPAGTGTVSVIGVNSAITSGTAVASTSGTSIDFTGIPSWTKRITVMLNGVSTNGTAYLRFQLGVSGSVETTGYSCVGTFTGATTGASLATSGFDAYGDSSASFARSGTIVFNLFGSNTWVAQGSFVGAGTYIFQIAGLKTLAGTLNMVRITTLNGTDTFDAGSINILYE